METYSSRQTRARVKSEMRDFLESAQVLKDYFVLEQSPQSQCHLTGVIFGPLGTPYEKGNFQFDLFYLEGYPQLPLRLIINTKIFHPNIDQLGRPCMNILFYDEWTPDLNARTVLVSLLSLLAEPNSNKVVNQEAGRLLSTNKALYLQTAKEWTKKYATEVIYSKRESQPQLIQ